MDASFLKPRPGDGAWLLERESPHRPNGNSFLRPHHAASQAYGHQSTRGRSDSTKLPDYRSFPATSLATRDDEARTTAAENALSQNLLKSADSHQYFHPTAVAFNLSTSPTANRSLETNDTSDMASAPGKKVVLPHQRKKLSVQTDFNHQKPSTTTDPDRGIALIHESVSSLKDSAICMTSPQSAAHLSGSELREKLSEHGAKISEPRATSYSAVASTGLHEQKAPQPPSSPRGRGGRRGNGRGRGRGGKATTESEQPSVAEPSMVVNEKPRRATSPAFRGRGRGGRQGGRGSRWPTSKEIINPRPGRDPAPMSVSGWSMDSAQADPGFGGGQNKRAPADASGYKLTDWSGGWAPAPINWDSRPAFSENHKAERVEHWIDKIDEAMCGCEPTPLARELYSGGDVLTPYYWVPIVIGNQAPSSFFAEMLEADPDPIDPEDLAYARPWWDLYQSACGPRLQHYQHPDISGIDPDETQDERLARENDHGADKYLDNKRRTEQAKQQAKREKRQQAETRAKEKSKKAGAKPAIGNRIKPGLNMYVRSAQRDDLPQIRDVYNYYVDCSCYVPETEWLSTADIQARFDRVVAGKLPFLVACERGAKIPSRRGRNKYGDGEDMYTPDRVVGFAMAENYEDPRSMYRFACEIQVFIKNEHYMKGVASCLLDKLTALVDPTYVERGGFDVQGDELDGMNVPRIIRSIVARVPYDKPERLEWTTRWLTGLGYDQVGDLPGVCHKDGKSVSVAMFLRKTGADTADSPE